MCGVPAVLGPPLNGIKAMDLEVLLTGFVIVIVLIVIINKTRAMFVAEVGSLSQDLALKLHLMLTEIVFTRVLRKWPNVTEL